ncbi:MAG: 50S ribosomal protein L6 [Clostridiales bacterium]|nr:50S ribosomal protein L6 [Clostridiales bacterium]
MSRIGKMPVKILDGVSVNIDSNNLVTVNGPLGTLSQIVDKNIKVTVENNEVILTRNSEAKEIKAKHGLYRALIFNMVKGVKEGFKKVLVINGVGYRATKQGNKLVLNIGYSKPAEVVEVEGIKLNALDANRVEVSGINKELVGQVASKIRDIKPVEPYHAYGIRYENEEVIRKEGKKAGKK